ncbi:hypothetical protein MMC14_006978 [Varicellaria rhodocarpa]|nr:hypothetical protein [Varicellaria rhodocarpa]
MLPARRIVFRLTKRPIPRQQRRFDSSNTPSEHAASAGHAEPTHHGHHPEPVNESLGPGFYIALSVLPLSFAFYKYTTSSSDPNDLPLITKIIKSYSQYGDRWLERNTRHTKMVEQAAFDRNLFQSSPGTVMVDLKFPEIFNTGSPYNVPAGHSVDLSHVIKHYHDQNAVRQAKHTKNLEEENKKSGSK